jgi:ankyrin repeat protein
MAKPELAEAVSEGDLETIRSLLDDGADVRYVRPHGYTVMIDVMHGRSILEDSQLLPVLRLLIDRGADLDAVSDYGESALSVSSRVGRFDAVELLLSSGANPAPLGWTALHRAVALGKVDDVRQRLEAGDDVTAFDRWERTPLLLSLQTGDIEKAELLLAAGGSLADRGRCGRTPLMYPVENDDPAMLRWLLERGVDPNATDDFGGTALIAAAQCGSAKCVRVLLEAGADPNLACNTESPIRSAANLEIARMLAEAGADFAEVNGDVRDEITRRPRTELITCTPEEYHAAKHRIFGNANPQVMNFPFWRAMVTSGQSAYHARAHFDQGRLDDEAVWCFDRFGKSFTVLPDGRVIEIAGEHEDHYDPDFCIYNDVIVHHGDGGFDIYGYPRDVFPPTDFHTATLVGDFIYIVGNLGYLGERRPGATQVYRLNVDTLAIEPVETRGESPGWIGNHRAKLVGNGIEVTGGKVCGLADREETYEDNHGKYVLDLGSMTWSKTS